MITRATVLRHQHRLDQEQISRARYLLTQITQFEPKNLNLFNTRRTPLIC